MSVPKRRATYDDLMQVPGHKVAELIDGELHFGDDVLVPDITGWRRERMPRIPNVAGFTLAPDWWLVDTD